MQLTIEGHRLLESGRVDDAISVLERAVGLDPANGQNYYYLSDAWLRKGDIDQAEEFNRLAELYLKDNRKWRSRIKQQQEWIGEYKEERLHQ
jgi:tetratricopeptide (TPR) repeat protein